MYIGLGAGIVARAAESAAIWGLFVISVVIPCYNAAATIGRAIDSALAQRVDGVAEIIVVDDASSDGGPALIRARYGDTVRVLEQPHNLGPAAARNAGFAAAREEWIGLLDADDAWAPGRVAALLPALDGADAVADTIVGYDAAAELETGPFYARFVPGPVKLADLTTNRRAGEQFDYGYLKPLFRRAFIVEHGLRYDPDVRQGEDFLFYVACLLAGARFWLMPSPGYVYSTWVGAVSRQRSPHSKTRPDGLRLARSLEALLTHSATSPQDAALVQAAADEARREAGAWDFHDAVLRRDLIGVGSSLIRSGAARRALARKLGLG